MRQILQLEGMLQTVLMSQLQLFSQLEKNLADTHRQQLLEMAQPIAAALQRQDEQRAKETETLLQVQTRGQQQTVELLMEVLNSLQPPVEQQLLPRTGSPTQPLWPPNSES